MQSRPGGALCRGGGQAAVGALPVPLAVAVAALPLEVPLLALAVAVAAAEGASWTPSRQEKVVALRGVMAEMFLKNYTVDMKKKKKKKSKELTA